MPLPLSRQAYLRWSGLSELAISQFRSAGAFAGLAAAAVFPGLVKRYGLRRVAAGAVSFQLVLVAASALPVVAAAGMPAHFGHLRAGLLPWMMVGIAISRAGLWLFSLAVNQVTHLLTGD